jgi:hypothetical protein
MYGRYYNNVKKRIPYFCDKKTALAELFCLRTLNRDD